MDVATRTAAQHTALHRFGARAHRIAFIGDDPVLGLGAGVSESALPGLVADLLTPRTRRGLDADLYTGPGWPARVIAESAPELRLGRYDALVLAFAPPPRLLPSRGQRWIRAAFDAVLEAAPSDTEVVVLVGAPARGDAHLARTRDFIEACRLDLASTGSGFALLERSEQDGPPTLLAQQLADRLSVRMVDRGEAWRYRDSADEESARQRAVERSGVLDIEPDPPLRDLLDRARTAFSTPSAELTVIDGDRQWKAAVAGASAGEQPRERSYCDVTIRHADGLVVGDAQHDPRFESSLAVRGDDPIRFYAGFPIESTDGYRIGALCVYDSEPRDPSEFDLAVLRDLALSAQQLIQERRVSGQLR